MRHDPIDSRLFSGNRSRLGKLLLPNSLAVVNTNDLLPTNADGLLTAIPGSDFFYLAGVEQEESLLLLYPDADDETHREILFLRKPTPEMEIWEGHKLTKEEARKISGVKNIQWLQDFPRLFHRLMCECEHVYLNSNEHKRAVVEVETREARFVADTLRHYPLHDYQRLARVLHQLRAVKSEVEVDLVRRASEITEIGFRAVLDFVQPGVSECEVEAEFAREFIRNRGRFAYNPIIASGLNACCLHYNTNSAICRKGELLLLDVAASYANYNSDLTRTIPVSGRFTPRQRLVYEAVLKVLHGCIDELRPGKRIKDWQKQAEQMIEEQLVNLKLISMKQLAAQDKSEPLLKKYFMHGVGHPLGLDVHDVGLTTQPIQAGWIMTVEPAIYIPEEKLAVRLENDVLVTEKGNVDLMSSIPLEPDEIEELMSRNREPKTPQKPNSGKKH